MRRRVCAFIAIVTLTACGGSSGGSSTAHQAADSCGNVASYIIQGAKDYGASDFKGGYTNAQHAIRLIGGCPNSHMKVGLSGAAFSVRAWNEHHLPTGDSMADMKLAYGLLKTCIDDSETPSYVEDLCRSTAGMNAQITAGW